MIPPNRVFRTSETNSLRTCKEQCIEEGKRCQSFALGISAAGGGNGTCQLSKERVYEAAGRRPRNTVYDPDYNLYQRKENCGIQDNNEMPPKDEGTFSIAVVLSIAFCFPIINEFIFVYNFVFSFCSTFFSRLCFCAYAWFFLLFLIVSVEMPTMITIQSDMPSDRPEMTVITTSTTSTHTNTMVSSSIETDRSPTVQTTADSSTTNDMTSSSAGNTISTNPTMSEKPAATTSTEHQSTHNTNPSTFSSGTIPTTNMYPNTNIDSTKMPSPPTVMTTMERFPSTATTYGTTNTDLSTNEVKPQTYPPIYMNSNKPDDSNYPYPPHFPNKYNYYHEIYPMYTYPTYYESNYPGGGYLPAGSSGGGGSSAGGNGYAQNIPTISYQPEIDYYGTTPTMTTYGSGAGTIPNTAATYMGNGWSNIDEMNRRKQPNGAQYPDREHSGSYPEGKYNGTRTTATVPYIRTIFNPDFYLMDAKSEY